MVRKPFASNVVLIVDPRSSGIKTRIGSAIFAGLKGF